MEKYKVFEKLKKTRHCSYYNAENLINHEIVTIKKLSKNDGWDELLNKKQIALIKQSNLPFLIKVKEIIKQNGKLFVVHEELTQCVEDLRKKKLNLDEVANIGKQILEIVHCLSKEGVHISQMRPEFFFVNRKKVKLAHIVSIAGDQQKGNIEEPEDYRYFAPEVVLNNKVTNSSESNVFTIGLIVCQLLIGKPLILARNKIDYMYMLCGLFPKQRLDNSTIEAQNRKIPNQTVKTFDQLMQSHCQSTELIGLLGEMTKVNYKHRIQLTEAIKRMKTLQSQFRDLEQKRLRSKIRLGNSLDTKTILATMEKVSQQIADERFRLSPIKHPKHKTPKVQEKKEQQKPPEPQVKPQQKKKVLNINHQIDLKVENETLDKIGSMPQIARESQPLRSETNVQDNAYFSKIVYKESHSDFSGFTSLRGTPTKLSLPSIKMNSFSEPKSEHKQKISQKVYKHIEQNEQHSYKQIRLKTQQISLKHRGIQTSSPSPVKQMTSQSSKFTIYALNGYNHFGVDMTADCIYDSDQDQANLK